MIINKTFSHKKNRATESNPGGIPNVYVKEIVWHRNGCNYDGFYAISFKFENCSDVETPDKWVSMIATVFPHINSNGYTGAIRDISVVNPFDLNQTMRGDYFAENLMQAIKFYERSKG